MLRKTAFLITTSFALFSTLHADIAIHDDWYVSGDERLAWVEYDYGNPHGDSNISQGHKDSEGFFFLPKLSIGNKNLYDFEIRLTGAASTDFGLNNPAKNSRTFGFGSSAKSYAILQEAYIVSPEKPTF